MKVQKFALRSASLLAFTSALLWCGSASAAPPSPAYPRNSAALFASVMQAPALIDQNDSNENLAPDLRRQVVSYVTPVAAGTIIIDTAQTYLYYVLGDGR